MKPPPCVLTIAGSDSGAGAGIQADARTIHALGGYALTAITAITAQNTRGIQRWQPVPSKLLAAQIESVMSDFRVAGVKTGLLPGASAVRMVAATLSRFAGAALVVDPVIGSTSGTRFLSPAGLKALKRELLSRSAVVTPNWPEIEALTGLRVQTFDDAEEAARRLVDECGCTVLVKGGHAPGAVCRDCLVRPDGSARWFESPRIATRNTHGTGCVLSAAIATSLACGVPLERAVQNARTFLARRLRAGKHARWGNGAGPAFGG